MYYLNCFCIVYLQYRSIIYINIVSSAVQMILLRLLASFFFFFFRKRNFTISNYSLDSSTDNNINSGGIRVMREFKAYSFPSEMLKTINLRLFSHTPLGPVSLFLHLSLSLSLVVIIKSMLLYKLNGFCHSKDAPLGSGGLFTIGFN